MERKQAVSLVVRLVVSAVMLVVLIVKVPSFDPADLVPSWSVTTALWLGIAAALTLAGIVLSALRWQKVLDALEIPTRLPRLMSLYLAGQLFDRGRLRKLTAIVHDAQDDNTAGAVVAEELDGLLEHVITEPERHDLYGRIVRNIRSEPVRASGGVTKADLLGALASFWLVFLASLPAAIPFMLMDDAMQALRMSNVVLLALLFFTGYRWAKYTLGHPWIVGSCFLIGGIAMVWTAIMLGG